MRQIYPLLAILAGCASATGAHRHDAMTAALRRDAQHTAAAVDATTVTTAGVLDRKALIEDVLARNPGIEAARQAWRAAVEKYPVAIGLDDPMLSYELAPLSIGSDAPFGQRIELSQKFPFPGKRQLAGQAALAEAEAVEADYEAVRVELTEMTSNLYDDYYVVARALEVNAHHHDLLESMRKGAIAQITVGHGSQQDALQAEAEIIELEREGLALEAERATTVARINGLLHRDASEPLARPPATLPAIMPVSDDPGVTHPKVAGAAARVRASEAEVAVGRRAFYPDLELMTSYDTMWDMAEHRWMIGAAVEIPLQRGKRRAAVAVARAEQARAEAELSGARDQLAIDVETTRRGVEEAVKALDLYQRRLLPTTRQRVDAALAGYASGANDFQSAIEAEHALREAELKVETARADVHRRVAALNRALGREGDVR